jgi:branched-chain amino acid transport system substrate-binding protein
MGSGQGLRRRARRGGWTMPAWRAASGVACAATIAALTACGSSAPSGGSAGAANDAGSGSGGGSAPPKGALVIGGVGPLSQPGAVQAGLDMQWAMQAAVADINDQGGLLGKKVALDFEDTQNQPDVAATVAKKLVEQSKVVGVAGEYHSSAALAQIPIYAKAGIPAVFSETYSDTITGGDPKDPSLPAQPKTVFRIAPTSSMVGENFVAWLRNGRKARKVVELYESSDYGLGQRDALKAGLEGSGVELTQLQVALNQSDYSAVLNRVKQEHGDADVVIFDVTGETSYTIEQNAFDVGLVNEHSTCVADQVAADSSAYWRAVPSGVGCTFIVVGPQPSGYDETAKSVAERYRAKFKNPPKVWVFEAYDAVRVLADAIKRANSTDSAKVIEALEATDYDGTLGHISFPYGSKKPVPSGQPSWLWHQWTKPPLRLVQYTAKGQQLDAAKIVWPAAGA